MIQIFNPISRVSGELILTGDKSISHRAVIFSAMADGVSEISNLSDGEDVESTINSMQALGTKIERDKSFCRIYGRGFRNFTTPNSSLDAGNSGTTARLLCGLLAAQKFESFLVGDKSLSQRPMDRIIAPLALKGTRIEAFDQKFLPLKISPAERLKPIEYDLPVASAQVKGAVLIAGLHSEQATVVTDKYFTRDHTERMLGLSVSEKNKTKIISASMLDYPLPSSYFIPSDISSASFFIILALLTKSSQLIIKNMSLNPTRIGFLHVLQGMNADIEILNEQSANNEPYGDIIIKSSHLKNIEISSEIIPNIIDEIPILSIAGLFAENEFQIRFADELRKKESDRINSLCHNFKLLGLSVDEYADGFTLSGHIKVKPAIVFESFSDHRIAMAFSVLSMLLDSGGEVNNFECVSISNPNFINQLKTLVR
jgi:3-phosphoshikimate 1-carboxyvinyltransferase